MPTAPVWPRDPLAPIPAHIRALIFDCDGTIADTMPLHFLAWGKALAGANIHMPEERFYAFAGISTVSMIRQLSAEQNVACDPEAVAHEKERYYIESLAGAEPIHSVVEIARREKGHRKLAVASGGWKNVVMQTLTTIGVEKLFDAIVGTADDVKHGKPAPDVFLKAAKLLNVPPENCVVYEDGELGFIAAQAAGMQVIDVRPWYLPRVK